MTMIYNNMHISPIHREIPCCAVKHIRSSNYWLTEGRQVSKYSQAPPNTTRISAKRVTVARKGYAQFLGSDI